MAIDSAQYLSSQEHRFELLINSVADYAIYMLDTEGYVTSWNAGAEKIKGYRPVEIIGQHFSRFFTADDQKNGLPDKALAKARFSGRHEAEGWRVRKDGKRFWANAILQSIRDDNGVLIGFAKITRDMTERAAAQQQLLDAERRFRVLVEGVIDYAIYMLDPSGIIVNWNTGAERLKGYSAAEIVGQHFSRFYTKQERAEGKPGRVLEIAAREGRYEAEGWRVRKDGSRFWASVVVDAIRNDKGDIEGFAKVTRDITERRAAIETVRESERQFRMFIAGVTDYALYMLDPNGVVISWNAGAERIKGYTADEIIGQHFSRFYMERDRASGAPARALHAAATEGRFEADAWRVRKDGSLFWANVVVDPVRDETGNLIGFAKITRDMTERREAQLALQEAQTQRAHAQKMDALGQLTGGVAHDFNNLLMVISGQLPRLKRMAGDDPKAARSVEAVELAARRGATLTRQLLSFSRRQAFNPSVLRLAERVEASRAMLASSIGHTVKVLATVPPDVWAVRADASELELAIVNLTINARDAMPEGGMVAITVENVVLAPADTPARLTGDFVAVRVADTGVGIAPDVLPRVFDPFFTTKQVDKGTGLGLSQVYGFAHQSAGTVTIDSELGRGTTVTIYLPRTHDNEEHSEEEPAPVSHAGDVVLVVEDNPEVAEVTSSMLGDLGYQVQRVGDAASALAAIAQRKFDLVVSDIVMPGALDGLKLARTIRERQPDLPVLLVTGYSSVADSDTEFTVLRKPCDIADLGRASARLIAGARQPPHGNVVRLYDNRH